MPAKTEKKLRRFELLRGSHCSTAWVDATEDEKESGSRIVETFEGSKRFKRHVKTTYWASLIEGQPTVIETEFDLCEKFNSPQSKKFKEIT